MYETDKLSFSIVFGIIILNSPLLFVSVPILLFETEIVAYDKVSLLDLL